MTSFPSELVNLNEMCLPTGRPTIWLGDCSANRMRRTSWLFFSTSITVNSSQHKIKQNKSTPQSNKHILMAMKIYHNIFYTNLHRKGCHFSGSNPIFFFFDCVNKYKALANNTAATTYVGVLCTDDNNLSIVDNQSINDTVSVLVNL